MHSLELVDDLQDEVFQGNLYVYIWVLVVDTKSDFLDSLFFFELRVNDRLERSQSIFIDGFASFTNEIALVHDDGFALFLKLIVPVNKDRFVLLLLKLDKPVLLHHVDHLLVVNVFFHFVEDGEHHILRQEGFKDTVDFDIQVLALLEHGLLLQLDLQDDV